MEKIKKRNPVIALILSLFIPSGQIYNGQLKKGILLYCSVALLFIITFSAKLQYTFTGLVIFIIILILLMLFIMYDSVINAVKQKDYRLRSYNKWYVYLLIIILSQCSLSSIKYFIINVYPRMQAYYLPSSSMEPTLNSGDYVYVDKMYYRKTKPRNGDIVVYFPPGIDNKQYIHRCIAIEGDDVSLKNNKLYINGKPIDEKYTIGKTNYSNFTGTRIEGRVPFNMIVVLGDNRQNSMDSRYFGPVPLDKLIGRPLYIYRSKERNRIGKTIE